jgi:hypothetical protein
MRDFDPPIVICCRDRVSTLRKLVEWLERAGHERIVFLDNASTYEPLIEYLAESIKRGHTVIGLEENLGSRALWAHPLVNRALCGDWFVYTDPDIVPIDDCPFDVVDVLRSALALHPEHQKAALGLYLADLPDDFKHREWETALLNPGSGWSGLVGYINGARIYDSLADTTFALYRSGAQFDYRALRLGYPYQARHLSPSWYGGETNEDRYYFDHAKSGPMFSSWKGIEAEEVSTTWLTQRNSVT